MIYGIAVRFRLAEQSGHLCATSALKSDAVPEIVHHVAAVVTKCQCPLLGVKLSRAF